MIPYSRPKRSDLYTLSHSKLLENRTLHSGTYLYSPYLVVPPPLVPRLTYTITVDSLNKHIFKRDTSVKQTPRVGPCLVTSFFDSLQDGCLYLINFNYTINEFDIIFFHSLHSTSQLDRNIKGQMIKDLFNLAGFRIPENLITTSTSRYQVWP